MGSEVQLRLVGPAAWAEQEAGPGRVQAGLTPPANSLFPVRWLHSIWTMFT